MKILIFAGRVSFQIMLQLLLLLLEHLGESENLIFKATWYPLLTEYLFFFFHSARLLDPHFVSSEGECL